MSVLQILEEFLLVYIGKAEKTDVIIPIKHESLEKATPVPNFQSLLMAHTHFFSEMNYNPDSKIILLFANTYLSILKKVLNRDIVK